MSQTNPPAAPAAAPADENQLIAERREKLKALREWLRAQVPEYQPR